jgi:hypothetical protein
MSTVSALLRTVVCFRVCGWDSISNADGIAGGNALPHARARVKQTATLQFVSLLFSPHARVCAYVCGWSWIAIPLRRHDMRVPTGSHFVIELGPWGGGSPPHLMA